MVIWRNMRRRDRLNEHDIAVNKEHEGGIIIA